MGPPGHALGRDPPAGRRRSSPTGRSAQPILAAGGPDESIVQPEWAPDGTLHFDQRPDAAGGTCTGWSTGPRLEPLAPMEAEFADPPWMFDRSSYGFLPDGAIVAVGPLGRARPPLPRSRPAPRVGEVEIAVHRARVRCASVPTRSSRWPAAPGDPSVVARFDPVTLAPAGVLRRATHGRPSTRRSSREPESIEFPTTGDRTAHALYYPPTNPDVPRPRRRAAAARRAVARRPDIERVDVARPREAVPDQPRHRGRRRRLRREHRLRARRTAGASTGSGASSTSTTAWPLRSSSSSAATSIRDRLAIEGGSAGGYTTLAALAFRDVFAAGISLFGVGDLELLETRHATSSSRATTDRLLGPYPEAAALYRERSPINCLDRILAARS